MTDDHHRSGIAPLGRLRSGIAGLDTIVRGGFYRGGIIIVQGPPGTGKTILGNQLCYNHTADGGRALYVTLLSESHHRMLSHMRDLSFFRPEAIAVNLHYVSGFSALESEGLRGLMTLLRHEIVARRASLLVLDGLVQAGESAGSATEFKKFIHELQAQASITDCTMFLLTSVRDAAVMPEHTMVDGMIELADEYHGWRAERNIRVTKFRGGPILRGRHAFQITNSGIVVHPRLEAAFEQPTALDAPMERPRLPSGVAGIDAMAGGGLPAASTTLLLGPSGAGKTTFGLQFLSCSTREEPGLLFGFYETPPRMLRKATGVAPGLGEAVAEGAVAMIWQPPTVRVLDRLGHELLDAVTRTRARRVLVDGLNGFQRVANQPERMTLFFTALSNQLRALGVTAMFTMEAPDLVGPVVRAPVSDLTQLADNLILLRYVELRSRLYRLLSILKLRDSDFDSTLREFTISARGIEVAEGFESAEAILSGFVRQVDDPDDSPKKTRRSRGR